jgi:hypothetical protein
VWVPPDIIMWAVGCGLWAYKGCRGGVDNLKRLKKQIQIEKIPFQMEQIISSIGLLLNLKILGKFSGVDILFMNLYCQSCHALF